MNTPPMQQPQKMMQPELVAEESLHGLVSGSTQNTLGQRSTRNSVPFSN